MRPAGTGLPAPGMHLQNQLGVYLMRPRRASIGHLLGIPALDPDLYNDAYLVYLI